MSDYRSKHAEFEHLDHLFKYLDLDDINMIKDHANSYNTITPDTAGKIIDELRNLGSSIGNYRKGIDALLEHIDDY